MATLVVWAAVRRRYWVCPGLLLWPRGPLPFRYPSTRRGHTRLLGTNQDREMEVIAPVRARQGSTCALQALGGRGRDPGRGRRRLAHGWCGVQVHLDRSGRLRGDAGL